LALPVVMEIDRTFSRQSAPISRAQGEAIHHVVPSECLDGLVASKNARHITSGDVHQRHRGVRIASIARNEGDMADVFHPKIPAVDLLHFTGRDLQRDRHVREVDPDQREGGFTCCFN
jgi:hypothetical protein